MVARQEEGEIDLQSLRGAVWVMKHAFTKNRLRESLRAAGMKRITFIPVR